jgi:hypothetical protein
VDLAEINLKTLEALASGSVPRADIVCVQTRFDFSASRLRRLLDRAGEHSAADRVGYLDCFAPTDLRLANAIGDRADVYVKKHVFRDRSEYFKSTRGDTNLEEYHSARYGITRSETLFPIPEGDRFDHAVPDVPLPGLIGSWLAGIGAAVSPETSRTWELYAGTHFIPHFRTTEGLCYERSLREHMRLRLGVVKARTVHKELSALRSLFAWMVERGLLQ